MKNLFHMFFIIITIPVILSGQTRSLSIDESITIAIEQSRSLRSSTRKAEYFDAKAGEAVSMMWPSIKFNGGYQHLSDIPPQVVTLPANSFGPKFPPSNVAIALSPIILDNYTLKASLQQPLFTGWKLQGLYNSASASADASYLDLEKDRMELLYNVRTAYWTLYRARDQERLAKENVEVVEQHLVDITNMADKGLATDDDILKVKVQLSNSKILFTDARTNSQLALLSFNSTLGIPLNTEVSQTTLVSMAKTEVPTLDSLLFQAFNGRPDVKASSLRVQSAKSSVTAMNGGWWPQVYLNGNYYYSKPNQRFFPAQDVFKNTWDAGITLQFDIWNSLNTKYQASEAQAQYEISRESEGLLRDGVTLEVSQSYYNYQQSKEKVSLAALAVDQSTEHYRITVEKFKSGLATNTDLLDAETTQLQAKIQYSSSLIDLELAQAKLEKAIGVLR